MSLATARKELAAALKPSLGRKYNIFPAPQHLDTITKPTLVLIRTEVTKLPQAPIGFHQNTFALWIIEPKTISGVSEDSLDDLLEEVLEALDENTVSLWSTAVRDEWNDTNPAYRITLTAPSKRKA